MHADQQLGALSNDVFLDAPGGRLFVRTWGDLRHGHERPPIVLIHDSLGSVELWRDFPSKLRAATEHPVVAYDRRGFGRSDPHPGVLQTPGFIRDEADTGLQALRVALGIDRMILFGHSVGGAMAIVAATRFAAATVAVITESTQVFAEDLTLTSIRAAKAAFAAPGQIERLARYHGDKAAWVLNAWTASWLDPAFASWTLDNDLPQLRSPILAMHGDHDEFGSLAHTEHIAARASAPADIVIFANRGHVPHREDPDAVVLAVQTFIGKRVPYSRSTTTAIP